jgi:hypothetical protein
MSRDWTSGDENTDAKFLELITGDAEILSELATIPQKSRVLMMKAAVHKVPARYDSYMRTVLCTFSV